MYTSKENKGVFKTIESHKTEYENPIRLNKGENVKLGERAPEKNWKDWIWAENNKKEGGWVPIQIVDFSENQQQGIILEDYSAKELNINKGELITKLKSINGWTWVRKTDDNDEGWIPNEIIEKKKYN
ncbi:SH3 domain-containing protein [Rapidithrix thailandica]|uniref:SH3 domain-containing protein n=1 Tax=Rapidithrix thailandica TaxID=413964 RepID=A0AAW9SBX1_9BACT